ncbi:MAG TPA: glycoside hydrolase family 125 protein [candidate division Zixibacteria bacterium]|nr:glycoside hydrolase family 125 protein [candidate division Zixibacteria bacterium]
MTDAVPGAKPIDLGSGVVAASFGYREPSLLSLTTVHHDHGVVELTGAPAFDEAIRGDPQATRAYRAMLAADASACCWLEGPRGERPTDAVADATDPARPRWTAWLAGARVEATARVIGADRFELRWTVSGRPAPRRLQVRVAGRLERPALAMVTETDPPASHPVRNVRRAEGGVLTITAPELSTTARLEVSAGRWVVDGAAAHAVVEVEADRLELALTVGLAGSRAAERPTAWASPSAPAAHDRLTARALAYVRGCTALQVGPDERVILTDHRLLPLSWTRDAYYQALLLLAAGTDADLAIVADHLRWLWRRCERPDGTWARSHHADGRRKDRSFQADQQLYPALELCDFWRATGALPDGLHWTDAVATWWSALQGRIDPVTGLLASSENAADDPAGLPFIGSTQVIRWCTARRLAEVAEAGAIGLDPHQLRSVAERTRAAFADAFEHDGPWPYAVDGRGTRLAYHDANDLPLALAPFWGFCDAGDPGWQRTVEFAWSPANPGWYPGERGGLGSAHTPHPWTLGDVQDWLVGRATGDASRCEAAVRRLEAVAFHDGMLPEAYSAATRPDLRIRHWFAWPGAAWGALQLLDAGGDLERRLRA